MNHRSEIKEILGALYEPLIETGVVEISVNPTLDVFVERFGQGSTYWGRVDELVVDRFIRYCSTYNDTIIDEEHPAISGRVPGFSHRIEALIPPNVAAPTFSIRRHLDKVIKLDDYVTDPKALDILKQGIVTKQNIVIAGSTGSGKTTLTNSCIHHLSVELPDTRVIILEDTPEINTTLKNRVHLLTSDYFSMGQLLESSLRLAPDRIMVGEVRSGIVLMTMMKAWNTGHPGGITTLHANSASEVLSRLQQLSLETSVGEQTPFILSTLDMVVFVTRTTGAPYVAEIQTINRTHTHPRMETIYVKS